MAAHHTIRIRQSVGALELDISVVLSAPWTVLFGPSGSGKTTILRAVAGLARGDADSILRGKTDISQLPPHERNIRYAPQRASLFPHLTVAQNVAYGSNGSSVDTVMAMFGLQTLAAKMPARLSGGERQRVSLARAFAAANCSLLLLDEPFTGLDRKLRDDLLPRMQEWLVERGIPVLSVTHDVVEALRLQAEVIAITDGEVTAQGEATQVLAAERTRLLQQLSMD